jgi:hypothetical protein
MYAILLLIALAGPPAGHSDVQYPLHARCRGLEAYDIQGTQDVDWAWGTIRAKDGSIQVAFAMGVMTGELVPAQRPPGFRTFKVARVGRALLRYGCNVPKNQIQATLLGARLDPVVNLIGAPKNAPRFVEIAKILATAPCEVHIDRR